MFVVNSLHMVFTFITILLIFSLFSSSVFYIFNIVFILLHILVFYIVKLFMHFVPFLYFYTYNTAFVFDLIFICCFAFYFLTSSSIFDIIFMLFRSCNIFVVCLQVCGSFFPSLLRVFIQLYSFFCCHLLLGVNHPVDTLSTAHSSRVSGLQQCFYEGGVFQFPNRASGLVPLSKTMQAKKKTFWWARPILFPVRQEAAAAACHVSLDTALW